MRPRTLFLCCAGGSGLWAVAGGIVTRHPFGAGLGLCVFLAACLLVFSGPNHPTEDSTR